MQKKRNTKYRRTNVRTDICAVFFCLLGAASSLFLFWKDMNSSLSKLSETPIGTVYYKYKAVQRRFRDRLIWDRLQRTSKVYNGDVIRTAELSDVSIIFADEDSIDLAENSLIQIFTDQEGIRIELSGGSIGAKVKEGSGKVININSGQNQVRVEGGSAVNLQSDSITQKLNLQVMEGSASLSTTEGVQTVAVGTAFSVDEAGKVETKPQVAVISPRPNQMILNTQNVSESVNFSWNPMNFTGDESVWLDVAADRGFTRPLQHLDVSNRTEVSLNLPEGNYWWRVYPISAKWETPDQTEMMKYKLTILHKDMPEPINPAQGSTYQYQEKIPPIEFAWTVPQGDQTSSAEAASSYLLEVANNPDIRNPQFSRSVGGTFLTYSGIGAGTWYWRVTPVYSRDYTGETLRSPIGSFRIEQEDVLPPPSLTAPVLGSLVSLAPEERNGVIYFSWKNEPEAASYTIQIGKDWEFKNILITKRVPENFYSYRTDENILQEGTCFWRVFYTSSSGISSRPSEVRSFIALKGEIKHEALFPPQEYTVDAGTVSQVTFTWKKNPSFSSRFQISPTGDFTRLLVNELVTGSSYTGQTLPVGAYYWRITTELTIEGSSSGATVLQTPPRRIVVVPPLGSPELESPQGQVGLNPQESLVFRWRQVPEVETYRFALYRGDTVQAATEQKPVYENPNLRRNTLSLSMNSLEEGTYFWTLQAIRAESPRSSRMESVRATGQFWLKKRESMRSVVTLESLASGQVIKGLDAYRNAINLQWTSREPVGKSRFILSKHQNPLEGSPVMDISNPDTTIKLTRLEAGTYYWTIQAETPDGLDISAPAPVSFQVLPVTVSSVSLDFPKSGQTIKGLDALRNPETIRWSSTERVGRSRLILSRNANPLRGQSILDVTNPGYSIRLPKLAEGTYYWIVQAETPDGLDISAPSPISFQVLPVTLSPVSLDFPKSGQTIKGVDALRNPETIRWSSKERVGRSRFVLSRNANPLRGQSILDVTNPGYSIRLPKLAEGTYYWTIQAETPDGLDISAPSPISFRVLPVTLSPVNLEFPKGGQTFTGLDALRTPITVRWTSTEEVKQSRFILSRNPNPLQGETIMTVPNPGWSIPLSKLPEGTYYWIVQAETPEGLNISAPAPASFRVLPITLSPVNLDFPKGGQTFTGIDALRTPITVRWSSTEEVKQSRFILSRNPNPLQGEAIMTVPNPGRSIPLSKLPEGTYYWIVQAETPEGLNISASAPVSFRVLPVTLSPVNLDFPKGGQTFTGIDALRTPITVRWSSTEEVKQSRFILSRNPNPLQGEAIMTVPNPGRSIPLSKLPEGTYYWIIQAETPEGLNISASAPASFQILPITLSPVNLEFPKGGQTFTGLDALRTPITVQWSSTEEVKQSRFILSRNPNPLQGEAIMSIPNPGQSIPLSKLPEGTYYWIIQAETFDGLNISAAAPASFQVLPLSLVSLDFPRRGQTFTGIDALRTPITVQWSSTEEVRQSRFILSRNPNPLQGEAIMSIPNPGRSIPLSKLPEGTYYWIIQAETSDGLNISASAPASFQVLPIPLLPAVQGAQPVQGYHITAEYLQENRNIIFEWNPVPKANAYRFTLLKAGSREGPLVKTDPIRQTRYVFDNLSILEVGDFIWQVEALSIADDGAIEQRGIIGEHRFTLDIPIPSNPVLRDPGILYGH